MLQREMIDKLRSRAQDAGRSYQKVCIEAGVDRQALTTWVGKTRNPSLASFIAVAETLGFNVILEENPEK